MQYKIMQMWSQDLQLVQSRRCSAFALTYRKCVNIHGMSMHVYACGTPSRLKLVGKCLHPKTKSIIWTFIT